MTPEILRDLYAAAGKAGLDPINFAAIAQVESGGQFTVQVNGRPMPLILYEFHVFDRNLPAQYRMAARVAGLASERRGAIPYPKGQTARYALLESAKAFCAERGLSPDAAYAACSWGIGQVLGENAQRIGYDSAEAMARECIDGGLEGQARAMIRYIEWAKLGGALNAGDWTAFARGYNGKMHATNGYAEKMARAAERLRGRAAPVVLRIGDSGPQVRAYQEALDAAGFLGGEPVDGIYGPATRDATLRYQAASGLVQDGIAGGKTWASLKAGLNIKTPKQPGQRRKVGGVLETAGVTAGAITVATQIEQATGAITAINSAAKGLAAAAGDVLGIDIMWAAAVITVLVIGAGAWLKYRDRWRK